MLFFLEDVVDPITDQTTWEKIWNSIINWLATEGLKLLLGLIALYISFKIINFIGNRIKKSLQKHKVDKTIENVVISVFRKCLKVIAVAALLGYLGFETSSIAALITSLGVGIGLALQGALSNVAGGIIIIFTRPFKLGDFIETCDRLGTVEHIKIFHTVLVTPDNKVIMIPNGNVANNPIVNYSLKDTRRIDWVFAISSENDFIRAKEVIAATIKKLGVGLDTPQPFINISSNSINGVEITTRVWCKSSEYWTIYFKVLEEVKIAFDNADIAVPRQLVDVKVKNN